MHRLNNILVICFYQNQSIRAQTTSSGSNDESVVNSGDSIHDFVPDGEIDEMVLVGLSKTKVSDLPTYAREVLKALNNAKDIVRYVKLVS